MLLDQANIQMASMYQLRLLGRAHNYAHQVNIYASITTALPELP